MIISAGSRMEETSTPNPRPTPYFKSTRLKLKGYQEYLSSLKSYRLKHNA